MTRIVCAADLHENLVDIPECDVLLIAGDGSFAFKGRHRAGLKTPDCCVLLAAQDAAAEAVLTFDDALGREVERLGLRAG